MSSFQVKLVTTPEEKEIAMKIRFKVFIDEQKFDPAIEIDEYDDIETTKHFLGMIDGGKEYVAVARCVLKVQDKLYKVGRVAILPEHRGKKLGALMMKGMEETLKGEVDTLMLHSQYDKKGFYEKCGYVNEDGKIFMEEGVEHCKMIKRL
jgi:predicted GNAT family N-acyltransferase